MEEVLGPAEWLAMEFRKSDIRADSPAYSEISAMLRSHGLEILFWRFECKSSSAWARAMDGGGSEVCPALGLFFRYETDFLAQKVDPHFGNWNDDWPLTAVVRKDLNDILSRLGYTTDYISSRTFIFLQSWETVAIDLLGRTAKPEVHRRISQILCPPNSSSSKSPCVHPKYFYWHSSRCYFVVLENAAAFEVALPRKEQMERAAEEVLSAADSERYCGDHRVKVSLWHMEMKDLDLYGMSRED